MADTKVQQVSQAESEMAIAGPAYYVDRFFVHVGPIVRLTFTEQGGLEKPNFRCAVAMTLPEAVAFKNLLEELLREPERQMNEALKAGAQNAKPA